MRPLIPADHVEMFPQPANVGVGDPHRADDGQADREKHPQGKEDEEPERHESRQDGLSQAVRRLGRIGGQVGAGIVCIMHQHDNFELQRLHNGRGCLWLAACGAYDAFSTG